MVASHKTEISEMRGLGRAMPITMAAFLIGSLSIVGLPPFAGIWSKWYLTLGALEADQKVLAAVLVASSLLSAAYLLPIPIRAFFAAPGDAPAKLREAPAFCVAALSVSALGCLLLFLFPGPLLTLAEMIGR
jgi:multicomponent Na+:H+ antiporter subunit D